MSVVTQPEGCRLRGLPGPHQDRVRGSGVPINAHDVPRRHFRRQILEVPVVRPSGPCNATLPHETTKRDHDCHPALLKFPHRDGKRLLISSQQAVHVINLKAQSTEQVFSDHASTVLSFCIGSGDDLMATS